MSTVIQFPGAGVPVVDGGGKLSQAGRALLFALWTRTGGALGAAAGSGTVTSVAAASSGGDLVVSGSPVTTSGTLDLSLATQAGVTPGAGFNTFTVNAKGIVTAASSAPYLTANQSIALSGDVTGTGSTGITATLAASGVTAGTWSAITVDAKGRATSGANLALTGDVTGTASGSSLAATLAASGVTAGTYGNVTVDSKGRVTAGTKGWERIASATLAANNATLINQTTGLSSYDLIRVHVFIAGYTGSDTVQAQFNALANSHQYHWLTESGHAASAATGSFVGTANQATNAAAIKLGPNNTTFPRVITFEFSNRPEATEKLMKLESITGTNSTGTAPQKDLCAASVITASSTRISQLKISAPSASLLAGSYCIIEGMNP